MRILLALALVGCGSSKPSQDTMTPMSTGSTSSPAASDSTPAPTPASAPAPTTRQTPVPTPTPTPTTRPPVPAATITAKKPAYSCFSYQSKNTTKTRYACMRAADCGPYLEQAKQVAGLKEITGCATVESVWCFHAAPSKAEPEGADVCQPTSEGCATERASVVKSGTSVDSDCSQQR
jgi:hypothetical protein